jgi:hypothetical protein
MRNVPMTIVRIMVGAAILCSAGLASADTMSFTPAKDNTLYETDPGFDLSNGAGAFLFAGVTNIPSRRRALIAFDVSAIPPGSHIDSVTLKMYVDRTVEPTVITLHKLLGSWGEGTSDAGAPGGMGTTPSAGDATWNDRFFDPPLPWATPGGDFEPGASANASVSSPMRVYTWGSSSTLVADVQSWIDVPGSNFGWAVLGDESGVGNAIRISSREGSSLPLLAVTFTVPSCGSADFNCDGDVGTDSDIASFFSCLSGECPPSPCTNSADFNGDGDIGTDTDIEAFFRVLSGGSC